MTDVPFGKPNSVVSGEAVIKINRPTITDTISAYLKEIRSQWANYSQSVVRISQIETRLLGIKGIVDISNTKINGTANNLTLDKYEIPVMGGVSG